MSIFTVSQPRMAAVRPPAGGQSLKQNYDLDQVKGMVFNNVVNFTEILLLIRSGAICALGSSRSFRGSPCPR